MLQRIFSFLSNYEFQLKRQKSSTSEETQRNHRSPAVSTNPGKDYVESLHQNAKSQLIYGKNNVLVQPVANSKKKRFFFIIEFRYSGTWSRSNTWIFISAFKSNWFDIEMDAESIDESNEHVE